MASSLPHKHDDDELESVAESLLGIDFSGAAAIPESIDLDDDDLFEDEEAAPVAGAPEVEGIEQAPANEPATRPSVDDDDDDSAFGFGLDIDDELDDISFDEPPPAARPMESFAEEPEAEPVIGSVAEPEPVAPAPHSQKKDDFWDALEGWDWGEEEKEHKGSVSRRARSDEESPRERPRSPEPPSVARSSFDQNDADDDEFGAGLLEDRGASASARRPEPTRAERPRRDEEQDSHRRGGRRGSRSDSGGRRGPRERGEPDDRTARTEQPSPPARTESAPSASEEDDTGFGAGLDFGEASPESTSERREELPREERRGRRRGRGRGRGRDRERELKAEEPVSRQSTPGDELDFDSEEPFGAEPAQTDETEVQESRFQDVPTWEEAISYLVKPRSRSGSGAGSGSQSEGGGGSEGSRQSSERESDRGRRRGGRRGGRGRPRD